MYLSAWKKSNPDRVSEIGKRDYQRNREKRLAFGARWRAANKERHKAMIEAWSKRNPDKVVAKSARYHLRHPERRRKWQDQRRESGRRRIANMTRRGLVAAGKIITAPLTVAVLMGRFALHGWRCYYCNRQLTSNSIEADHRIPVSRGGKNCGANIVPACRACNVRKGSMTELEFRERLRGSSNRYSVKAYVSTP
jgi:5-methylcytosine-specific restriction endonuclease McrA